MTDANPYTAPSSNLESTTSGGLRAGGPRSLPIGQGWEWVVRGFDYFKRSPGPWILTMLIAGIIYAVVALIPIIGQLAITVTSYIWLAGFYIGCKAQDDGKPFSINHLFAAFQDPGKLILLSLLMAVLSLVIVIALVAPILIPLLTGDANSLDTGFNPLMLLPLLIGLLVMIPLAMAVWFAPALIALQGVGIIDALKLSTHGCLKNILPMLIYGIVSFVLVIVGVLPLLLGLFVVFPVIIASTYVAYKDIFIEDT